MHSTKHRVAHTRAAIATRIAGLALVLALGACRDGQAPPSPPAGDAATTAAPAPASAPAAPAAPAAPMAPLRFGVDDPAIGTEVGVRAPGLGLGTSGRPGWLMFGPYATVPAGHYEVLVRGFVQAGHDGPLHVDVAAAKGEQVIAAADLPPADLAKFADQGALAVLPFDLAAESRDLEVRVRVTEASRVSVSGFEIRPRQ